MTLSLQLTAEGAALIAAARLASALDSLPHGARERGDIDVQVPAHVLRILLADHRAEAHGVAITADDQIDPLVAELIEIATKPIDPDAAAL